MSEPTAPGNPLDVLIAEYIQAAEAGKVPSRQLLLDAHPEYADDLRAFFADYDRLDNRADALKLVSARPPAQRPKVRYFGDYELLEEIAEGGMGLVYKARQESLGRIVALKLVRAGQLAKPIDIARFRIEAEAAAGLDHPNIVPLYEVGEHEGQNYLAMKFIDGPSLAKLPRGSIKTEVTRLEAVARAVDFAHRQGILHRDIKPSNILTDAAGTPFVTDFGLAKRIDAELSLTESGQMLGTAGYIAPEQALGKKGLTVTADVFSLGAVLFERLAGSPAFPGGTILERLRSLHESITPRPTLLMPTLPRDLETVCLKCLEREPGKRYASAGWLADDLSRWLRGEPIVARRVTQLERFWLWCRRNPAVAGLSGGIAVLLVAVAAVSAYSTVEIGRREVDAVKAKDEAVQAQARAEESLLASFLRPLGYNPNDLDPAERQVFFFELSELAEDRLRLEFILTAFSDADASRRIARRSERVVQAVVGANERTRQSALEMLSARKRDNSVDPQTRLAACWLGLELGSKDVTAIQESCVLAAKTTAANRDPVETPSRRRRGRLPASSQIGNISTAFAPFVAVGNLSEEQIQRLQPVSLTALSSSKLPEIIVWSAALTARLDPSAAIRLSDQLAHDLETTYEPQIINAISRAFAALAPQLDVPAAGRATGSLVRRLDSLVAAYASFDPAAAYEGFDALAARLDSAAALRAAYGLVEKLGGTKDGAAWAEACRCLGVLAGRMDSGAAQIVWHALAETLAKQTSDKEDLVGYQGKQTVASLIKGAEQGFAALAQRIEDAAAPHLWEDLVAVLRTHYDDLSERRLLRGACTTVAARMNAGAAATAADKLISTLGAVQELGSGTIRPQEWQAPALAALAPSLNGTTAARASDALVRHLSHAAGTIAIMETVEGLGALAPNLDALAAARAGDGLVASLDYALDSYAFPDATEALAAMAPYLDSVTAARAAAALVAKTRDPNAVHPALQALTAMAPQLKTPAAVSATEALMNNMVRTRDSGTIQATADAIVALAPLLDEPTAVRTWDGLVGLLGKETAGNENDFAVSAGLEAMAMRMGPVAANVAWNRLVDVAGKPSNLDAAPLASLPISALATRLDQPSVARIGENLANTLGGPAGSLALASAAEGLQALAPRLDRMAATRAAGSLANLLAKTTDMRVRLAAVEALAALAPRVDESTAALAVEALVGCLGTKADNDDGAQALTGLIRAKGPRLQADKEAAAIGALTALAVRSGPRAKMSAFDAIITSVGQMDGILPSHLALAEAMQLCETTANAQQAECRRRIGESAVAVLRRLRDKDRLKGSWGNLCFVVDQFGATIEHLIGSGRLTLNEIGYRVEDHPGKNAEFTISAALFSATTDLATIADCLRHPACVGETRQMVLHRLEELAFPPAEADQQQALAESIVTGLTQPLAVGVLAAGRQAKWERERKFRTIWDAVGWLNKNHPEIDLDKPYKPRK